MQFLSTEECSAWCQRNGFSLDRERTPAVPFDNSCEFPIPADAGKRVGLARLLWDSIASRSPQALIWVTQCGVWPSGEHRPLAEAARAHWGAGQPLNQQPGHVALVGEEDFALSMVVLAILSLWDCWLLPSGAGQALFLSHDEFAFAYSRSRSDREILAKRIEAFGLPTTSQGAA
jgi:hypothetical protein